MGEQTEEEKAQAGAGCEACIPDSRTDTVVVIANDKMGEGLSLIHISFVSMLAIIRHLLF